MVHFRKWTRRLSTLSSSSSLSDDVHDLTETADPPTLAQLYGEAVEFEKVLAKSGCIDCPIRRSHKDGVNGFADLIGGDLSQCEQALANHVNRLTRARLEPLDSFSDVKMDFDGDEPEECKLSKPIIDRVVTGNKEESWELDPPKIIELLQEEFGPLAAEDEEEKLLLETDGCLIEDVFIMGVIHVTTHRIAFHASLLESKHNMPVYNRPIKTGPAVLHRKGWHAKRRIWLELSHDMLCAYTSSSDEGRFRPLYTILFAFINKVQLIESKRPRFLHVDLDVRSRDSIDAFEFDTEESARDWRREITGALFLHRHQRQVALDTSISEEETGVRLSLPLNRIVKIRSGCYPEFPCIASLLVQSLPSEDSDDEDVPVEQETIHIGTLRPVKCWNRLGHRVAMARHRSAQRPLDEFPIIIDFGPLTFHESQSMPHDSDVPWIKEVAIRGALALGSDETHLWGNNLIRARIYGTISSTGYFVLSNHFLCFWSKSSSNDVKYRVPLLRIQTIKPFDISICLLHGLKISFKSERTVKLVFKNAESRDEAKDRTITALNRARFPPILSTGSSVPVANGNSTPTMSIDSETSSEMRASTFNATQMLAPIARTVKAVKAVGLPPSVQLMLPKAINLPREILTRMSPKHFVCLTIGSRGDVQPYIALSLGLMKEGHRVTIVTHEEYRDWIVGFKIGHRTAGGDPGALMKLSVENKMFSPEFFKESITKFRPWLDQLLIDAWEACHDADVLLESPSAMAGVHIAEALSTVLASFPEV
ncbi:hypothetical protein H0H93_004976 [Arthromyces matolae]|nr:hypothetical protein H0H93_004976 [Arthromyces matolae]